MNQFSGYPIKRGLGWWAMVRFARDAKPRPVMAKGERPKVFETEGEAWKEVTLHLLAFMNGREIRGERFDGTSSYRSEVDRVYFSGARNIDEKGVAA